MPTRALIEGFLGGSRYPASPEELAREVRRAGGGAEVLAAIARLRASVYTCANEVGEELFPVEPGPPRRRTLPHPVSGPPPGRERYTARISPGDGTFGKPGTGEANPA